MSVSSTPSKNTFPSVGSSSMFIVRSIVDLPDPEGPMSTMTSPGMTDALMPRSTWLSPNHL